MAGDAEGGQLTASLLDPQAQAFLELAADQPPLDSRTTEENRAAMRDAIPLFGEPVALADVRDATVAGPAGGVPVRVYRPQADGVPGAIVHLHPFVLLAGIIDDGREARAWLARRLGEALH